MRGIFYCNFAAARRLCIIFLGRPYSTYVKCPYVRGREIWDWVEAVLDFCKKSTETVGCLAVQLYPSAGGKRADPPCEMVVVVEPRVSYIYIYYGCCP